ncbi:MAG: hypothetical protein H6608_06875 [Flavobacteriales bacterium]|nr:hypothetical protein [Flavobacteriales bacterium]
MRRQIQHVLFIKWLLLLAILSTQYANAQTACDSLNLQLQNDIAGKCADQVMTLTADLNGKPYLYVANKSAGLVIHDLSAKDPRKVAQLPIDSFDKLEVMGVSHYGEKLYLALGNFFSTKEASGMAIVDISNPEKPSVNGLWKHSAGTEGASQVVVHGSTAYLAAFSHGIFILDISNPSNIQLISQFVPNLNFPDSPPDSTKINARGMVLENDVIYLSYDAGGIRIINVSNPAKPRETGRYSNPVMNKKPRAYNNAVKYGKYLFCGVDYCGMEVLDVSDTTSITQVSWWNPWKCHESPLNWFSSNGHVNEVRMDTLEQKLFVSTGKSDLMVIDVSDPTHPDSCSTYGGIANNIGTWGLSIYDNNVYLAYICTLVPFTSNWTGVKHLKFDRSTTSANHRLTVNPPNIYPNPAGIGETINIDLPVRILSNSLCDCRGQIIRSGFGSTLSTQHLQPGAYVIRIQTDLGDYQHMILLSN